MNYTLIGLVIYLILTLGIAWFYGRAKKSEDYLIAGRDLGMWSSAMTIISSKIGAGFIISIMAFVYQWGSVALFAVFGILVGYLLFIPFALYLKREADKAKYYTLPEFYRHKFGGNAAMLMAILMFLAMEISVVTQLIGGAHILADTSPVSYNMAVLVVAGVVLLYLLLGGFKSVVATDFLQGAALLGLIPIFLIVTIFAIGDISAIDLSATEEGIRNIPNFLIIGVVLPFATPELWQRIYAIKDEKTVKKTMIFSALAYTTFGVLITLLGLYFKGIVGDINPESLLIVGFEQVLPTAMATFGIIFLMSAVLSSFDTYVFTAAAILVQDMLSSKGKQHSGKLAVWSLRLWQLVLIVAAIGIAIRLPHIIDTTLLVVGIYTIAGVVGISAALRKEKLTNPFFPLVLGTGAAVYFIMTQGITPSIIGAGTGGVLLGLLINAIYSSFRKRLKA